MDALRPGNGNQMSQNMGTPTPRRSRPLGRNPGIPFDLEEVRRLRISEGKVGGRARAFGSLTLPGGEEGTLFLLRVLAAIDLTTLSGDDTAARVRTLCDQARNPLPPTVRRVLPPQHRRTTVAAVCVFPAFVPTALQALEGSGVPVATVSAGFPHGLSSLSSRVREVSDAARTGAQEIDVVIRREWALTGNWEALYGEIRAFRKAAGKAHLKVILGTGELKTLNQVTRASLTAMMAGADFVKTSTGKERVNATLPVGLAMTHAISRFRKATGISVGLKPAGGIRTAQEAFQWLSMVEEELGEGATAPASFRIGASSLLGDVLEGLVLRYR